MPSTPCWERRRGWAAEARRGFCAPAPPLLPPTPGWPPTPPPAHLFCPAPLSPSRRWGAAAPFPQARPQPAGGFGSPPAAADSARRGIAVGAGGGGGEPGRPVAGGGVSARGGGGGDLRAGIDPGAHGGAALALVDGSGAA